MASTERQNLQHGSKTVAISNAIVQIVRDFTGRGPVKARTEISDHLVTCVLGDGLTAGERTLVEHGKGSHVLKTREEFQDAMGNDLIAAVEGITDRKVLAYMSTNHLDPDLGIEAFVLETPAGEPHQNGRLTR